MAFEWGDEMALFWRIWTAVMLVNLVVLTLFVGLATLQFDSINSSLVGERLAVLAGRTAAPFQATAKIGLPLSTMRNGNALLERARQTDDAILAIHVFDETGRVVHSTDAASPAMIPPEALAARQAAAGAPWHHETEAGFYSSIDIPGRAQNAMSTTAGGILIVYPGGGNVTQIRAMGAELALAAIAVALAAAGLSALLLRLGLGRQIRTFEAIDGDIADFERTAWRSAASATSTPNPSNGGTGELRQLLGAAESRYRAIGQVLATTSKGAE
jgi:hypothetical protein